MKLVGLNWSSETNSFKEIPIDTVDNMYLEGDVDNGVAITYPDGSCDFVGKILVKSEVKEVDLDKEYERYYEQERNIQTFKLAKHFFELGLKAQKGE